MNILFEKVSDYAFKNKSFLLITFLLPPLAWLGIIYLGSLNRESFNPFVIR